MMHALSTSHFEVIKPVATVQLCLAGGGGGGGASVS